MRDRKNKDKDFRTLVRLTKKWRNHAELKPLKSFIIELLVANLLDTEGNTGLIEQRFRRILLYIAQSGLTERIQFAENTPPFGTFNDPVVIIDPVYSLNFASAEDDTELWKEIFGPRFKIEEPA
ncbi:hypothetical protein QRQ56_26610 [Bradyrhizobium sp. U531]|uniref:hypothetical protein n=1 Tax=Bradyrhizobium sp. U531 TaxID=3053458 RepID=UPI003F41DC67